MSRLMLDVDEPIRQDSGLSSVQGESNPAALGNRITVSKSRRKTWSPTVTLHPHAEGMGLVPTVWESLI